MLKEQIERLIEDRFEGSDYFLVEVKESPGKVGVFIDHVVGVKLDDCVELSRFLNAQLGEVLETRELEVSSPGMDAPLKVRKQYLKYVGKKVTVLQKDGIRKDGVLKAVSPSLPINRDRLSKGGVLESITIEDVKGRVTELLFEEIKETKEVFSFNKVFK